MFIVTARDTCLCITRNCNEQELLDKRGGSAPAGAVRRTETIRESRKCRRLEAERSRLGDLETSITRITAHTQESENTPLISILVQVFIYLQLFVSTSISIVWYDVVF